MDVLRPVLDQIGKLWARLDMMPVVRWATVTQASPLRVRMDGDTEAMVLTPMTLVNGLRASDRVLCVEQHRRVIVLGRSKGLGVPYAMSQGRSYVTPVPDEPTAVTVTFPAGRFTSIPRVQVTAASQFPGTQTLGVGTSGTTATGTTIYLTRTNDTETGIDWLAVQMTSGGADG